MQKIPSELIRINGIAGMLYRIGQGSRDLLVYGYGAPTVPDNGNLLEASICLKYDIDFFVPDYIGYGRSDGDFTPKNCINTFLKLFKDFSDGCIAVNNYSNKEINLKHQRLFFAGRSFGGTYAPLLPRFNSDIKDVCLIFPAIHNRVYGQVPGEESNEDFMRAMRLDGYKYLYRGILSKEWETHLAEKDDLSPMDPSNIKFLKDTKMFIGHGGKDEYLHHSRTEEYFRNVVRALGDETKEKIEFRLYEDGGHNSETALTILNDYLGWIGIEKRKNT